MTARTSPHPHVVLLDRIADAASRSDVLSVLRRSDELARAVGRHRPERVAADMVQLAAGGPLALLAALEAAPVVPDVRATTLLLDALADPRPVVRRHAAWRLGGRPTTVEAIRPLVEMLCLGGIDTMHAHRTLRAWGATDPEPVVSAVVGRMHTTADGPTRARLVDLVGTVRHPSRTDLLAHVAGFDHTDAARIAAIGALGELGSDRVAALLARLALEDGPVGAHAALALDGLIGLGAAPLAPTTDGHRVAQLVLAGELDGQLSLGGRGDTGGVASLLVSLGEALARRDDVDQVLTIGRGTPVDALTSPVPSDERLPSYGMLALDAARVGPDPSGLWEHLPAIERGLRRQLRMMAPLDVLHLRMADVGTLAGAEVAARAGVATCFSLAPDPHNVVRSLQTRGELDTDSFLALEEQANIWFRARLVERLARTADRLALFPRADHAELFAQLGVDPDDATARSAVVAEGIDVDLIRRVDPRSSAGAVPAEHRGVLVDLGERIPPERRHLPLLVSVGRLNPVKGMERIVRAWADDPLLRTRCNLVIVGGDLTTPSPTERAVLADIDAALPTDHPDRAGLVLLGGRPKADVATLLAATGHGIEGRWAPGGVYVDGALKEEFGLALLEALAAGLVVVAPSTGGPPTYVEHGDTGVLVDPGDDLASAVRDAFELVDRPGRAKRARTMVEERYSIDTMAAQLAALYGTRVGAP